MKYKTRAEVYEEFFRRAIDEQTERFTLEFASLDDFQKIEELEYLIARTRAADLKAIKEWVDSNHLKNIMDPDWTGSDMLKRLSKHPILKNSDVARSGYEVAIQEISAYLSTLIEKGK